MDGPSGEAQQRRTWDRCLVSTGILSFPELDEEFFKQLTAEELVMPIVKGYQLSERQKKAGSQLSFGHRQLC